MYYYINSSFFIYSIPTYTNKPVEHEHLSVIPLWWHSIKN